MADNSKSIELHNNNDKLAIIHQKTVQEKQSERVKKKKILDEETFVKDLETIIERDFFPDLEKLRIQKEYLTALENNDLPALRELYSKYSMHRLNQASLRTTKSMFTPTTFETPDIGSREKDKIKKPKKSKEFDDDDDDDDDEEDNEPFSNDEPPRKMLANELSLDKYLGKNTSEDNLSFEVIMDETEKKKRLKINWLFEKEKLARERNQMTLALPSYEKQMIENNVSNSTGGCLDMWSYTSKNSLMYIPEGVELTFEERAELEKREKIIKHENTRFTAVPFDLKKQKETLEAVSETKLAQLNSKLGVDGKELISKEPPKVNGYGYVDATPSPVPGRLAGDESPLMTWGEIESTPFRLDPSTTPYHSGGGPEFRIPDIPEREKIALGLEEKANAARRKTKSEALKHMQRSFVSPSVDSAKGSLTDRINVMSPAAQRLLSSKLNIRPGSSSRRNSGMTNSPSPRSSSFSPSIKLNSPITTPNSLKAAFRKPTDSLTDNLLKLPKKL